MTNLTDVLEVIYIDSPTNASSPWDDNITSTLPSSNLSSVEQYDVPTGLICLLAFLYGSISLLAVIGNGLVILVIVKNRRMHTVTNIFIANLAVADVIIGLFSIPFQFQAALLQRWVLANFMCSLAPFGQVVSVNISIFTLSVIAVDRYIAVIHPFKAGCSKKSAAIIITVIWAVAIGAGLPFPLFYWVDTITENGEEQIRCSRHSPEDLANFDLYYNTLLVCCQYLLPLVIITFCYCRIAWHIWGSRRPGAHVATEDVRGRNKRKSSTATVVNNLIKYPDSLKSRS
ncbi:neuropeptide Y receptor type 2-like [Physella acuta]|uniref:neuropeptide Y receptor type 2-like n=1 Tax=Physella acuta TaxID=109671 RepID=UPI0027DB4AAA|nr:neuropeptide Y receptor type 2-like [Physella acuta]